MYQRDTELVTAAMGTLVANKVGTTTATNYWLASRAYAFGGTNYYFWYGHSINNSGNVVNISIFYYSNGWNYPSNSRSIRPIVTLRADVTTKSGSGTSASPWVLS